MCDLSFVVEVGFGLYVGFEFWVLVLVMVLAVVLALILHMCYDFDDGVGSNFGFVVLC